MPGPPPTPLPLRLLKGNPQKRPLRPEIEPERPVEPPEAPPFLGGFARDEWYRVVGELHRLKLLTVLDINPLAAYCTAYARWRTAAQALAKVEKLNPVTAGSGLVIKRAQNPLVRIASRAEADMLRYASQFGFTPVARSRLAAGPFGQPPGKLDDLLGG
jgi:P27 family predicted phage terminase small subunit